MNVARSPLSLASAPVLSLVLLAACGGGSGGGGGPSGGGSSGTITQSGFTITNLVADSAAVQTSSGATYADSNLVNPWGIVFNPQGFVWVANQATSTSTLYDGNGLAQPLYSGGPMLATVAKGNVAVGFPTGVVYNTSLTGGSNAFVLPDGTAAQFLYATLGGTVQGWNTGTAGNTVIAYDGGAGGASYTGLAIGSDSGGNYYLYAANFAQGTVEVLDHGFNKVTPAGGFTDSAIPANYAPYGIQNIPSSSGATQIYVTYAQQTAAKKGSVAGAGLGYVAVFDATGNLTSTLISGGALNAPWGVALAPSGFGSFGGNLLIGNFGDGKINAYNPTTGALVGTLTTSSGTTIQIPGLWGIAFGNGINNQPASTLYFAAGINSEADGLYGRITFGTSSGGGTGTGGGLPY
jgi:uncharacterized protein (TIGR03118 family)